jgi:hypothetical protein
VWSDLTSSQIIEEVTEIESKVLFVPLEVPPVAGAVLWAIEELNKKGKNLNPITFHKFS